MAIIKIDTGSQVIEIETKDLDDTLYEEAVKLGITEMVKAGRFVIKPKGHILIPADLPKPKPAKA